MKAKMRPYFIPLVHDMAAASTRLSRVSAKDPEIGSIVEADLSNGDILTMEAASVPPAGRQKHC